MKTYSSSNATEISVADYTKEKKKKYFNNVDLNKTTNNKLFWKTVKPLYSNKALNTTKIYLVDEGKN